MVNGLRLHERPRASRARGFPTLDVMKAAVLLPGVVAFGGSIKTWRTAMYYCGLDLHAKSSAFFIVTARGRKIGEGQVPSTRRGFE